VSYQSGYLDPLAPGHRICAICGHGGLDVTPMIARLKAAGPHGPFTTMDRCRDVPECRERCEANGDPWPLRGPVSDAPIVEPVR
jgi:sugar phosphate isomerase/epimerase